MSITQNRSYQEGSLVLTPRAKSPDVWVYRWRENTIDGRRVQRKKVIGDIRRLPKLADAKRAVENLRAQVNASQVRIGKMTVEEAWGHFQAHELYDAAVDRSPSTIEGYLTYFKTQILPRWRDVFLDEVKAVEVERWLRSLHQAPGTKAKIRNHLSALFTHCIRHEIYSRMNPISSVRQSAVRETESDVITVEEMQQVISGIRSAPVRIMVLVVASTAIRRSELRGLRWADVDFDRLWLNLKRGVYRKHQTKMKTKASRNGVPILPELALALAQWRKETPYAGENDWVFASPYTKGVRPYWAESALKSYVRPAAAEAGIRKTIGWHTWRHSLATLLGHKDEQLKVIQELLRHATSRITADVYQRGNAHAKRSALNHVSAIFPEVSSIGEQT